VPLQASSLENDIGEFANRVFRHSHLLLFDDAEMLEVRYVLSLEHHDISIYGGGEHIPDGELFIKRNALCLSRKTDAGEITADGIPSKPFFLFADNTSDKEDFYFAMLKNQERKPDALNNPPVALQFDIKNMISLVQRLHSSEEHLQTRWINGIIGRIFLGLYKTTDVENFVRAKITKKISRVKKPSFLSGIVLRNVDMGEGAPLITNPRLKELTVEGDCVIEADVRYTGNFRLEIAATARIDLGTRFKAREVNLLLAVVLKKVEGHVFARVKPPPSNRIWLTFSQPPKIEMSIEPIVSSRQITYTVILRQIENRIKEVIAESIVMPYWDDIAFYSTEGKRWRGGVWVDDTPSHTPPDLDTTAAEDGDVDEVEHIESDVVSNLIPAPEKSMSVPSLETSQLSPTYSRKTARSLFNLTNTKATASSSSIDISKPHTSEKPRVLRHGSFTSASSPIVGMDVTNVDAFKATTPPEYSDAASAMAAISARSHTSSPDETPLGSPPRPSGFKKAESEFSTSSTEHDILDDSHATLMPDHAGDDHNFNADVFPAGLVSIDEPTRHSDSLSSMDNASQQKRFSASSAKSAKSANSVEAPENTSESNFAKTFLNSSRRQDSTSSSTRSISSSENPPTPPKHVMLSTVANAAATARRWGINALQRNGDHTKSGSTDSHDATPHLNQPMGRGRPLPPPGVPLPHPDRKTPTAPIPVPKRRPLPPPALPKRPQPEESKDEALSDNSEKSPPLPKRRPTQNLNRASRDEYIVSRGYGNENVNDDSIFVVAAPPDSEPTTPLTDTRQTYLQPWVDDEPEDEETSRKEEVDSVSS
jgi:hypothetical protein